jgi:hypothetical protein
VCRKTAFCLTQRFDRDQCSIGHRMTPLAMNIEKFI